MPLPLIYHEDYSPEFPADHRFPMDKFRLLRDHLVDSGLTEDSQLLRPQLCPADILALADSRDPFATPSATRRLFAYFKQCHREFVQIDARRNRLPKLGHFGFFHNRFANSLWPQSLAWLKGDAHPWPSRFSLPAESES